MARVIRGQCGLLRGLLDELSRARKTTRKLLENFSSSGEGCTRYAYI